MKSQRRDIVRYLSTLATFTNIRQSAPSASTSPAFFNVTWSEDKAPLFAAGAFGSGLGAGGSGDCRTTSV